ncbi:hypothetical protein QNH14_12665 [Apirhabdus apintestini]|nr:hypothetical protein QNH14_12665 [Enterobacteriaceae bacterium CA-0114]
MEQLQPIKSIASDVLEILQSGIAKGKMDDVLSSGMRMAKYGADDRIITVNCNAIKKHGWRSGAFYSQQIIYDE